MIMPKPSICATQKVTNNAKSNDDYKNSGSGKDNNDDNDYTDTTTNKKQQ